MHIERILRENNIPYVDKGKNVKVGNINIKCPWCGEADQSYHLGISLSTGAFSCWRNVEHRGRKPQGLLMRLLGCSYVAASALLTESTDLAKVIARMRSKDNPPEEDNLSQPPGKLCVPGLQPLTLEAHHGRFHQYLSGRGYMADHWPMLIELYDLRCALYGRFANRIVFPVYGRDRIIGHTGRSIDGGLLRYLSEPGDVIKRTVLWKNLLGKGGRRVYVCEGPFDAMRIDFVSRMEGIPDRATCLFGVSYTPEQVRVISNLKNFEEVVVLFDQDALAAGLVLESVLRPLCSRVRALYLPGRAKDPGGLSWAQVKSLGVRA